MKSIDARSCCLPQPPGGSSAGGPGATFHGQPSIAGWTAGRCFPFEWVRVCMFPGRRFRKSLGGVSAGNRSEGAPTRFMHGIEDRTRRELALAAGHSSRLTILNGVHVKLDATCHLGSSFRQRLPVAPRSTLNRPRIIRIELDVDILDEGLFQKADF